MAIATILPAAPLGGAPGCGSAPCAAIAGTGSPNTAATISIARHERKFTPAIALSMLGTSEQPKATLASSVCRQGARPIVGGSPLNREYPPAPGDANQAGSRPSRAVRSAASGRAAP